jgi:DDE superfamily endonuclease
VSTIFVKQLSDPGNYQASYPELRTNLNQKLESLRTVGVPLQLPTIRAMMVAQINHEAPEIFSDIRRDGSQFRCTESFVRKYLRNTLGWSQRQATQAAQKIPANSEQILMEAFLREAFVIRDHAIPAALRVNTDQTQTVYQQGTNRTWDKRGSKQVATVGQDEKRAFTLVPSISASGELLAMQCIYSGKTDASCPSKKAAGYDTAMSLGIKFEPSKSSTYWSTHATMRSLVNEIIAPYLEHKKEELGLSPNQCSIWKIDCWSVHKSEEFRMWMKKSHPTIIIIFIPGGCTGLWQPLDVGIQRVLKQSIKRSAHQDIVAEVSSHLTSGHPLSELVLDTRIGTLRDRSLGWIVNAMKDINDKKLIENASNFHQKLIINNN